MADDRRCGRVPAAAGPYLRRERQRKTTAPAPHRDRGHARQLGRLRRRRAGGGRPGRPAAARPARPVIPFRAPPAGAGAGSPAPSEAGPVAGVFLHTPKFPVVLTAVTPAAAAELAAVTLAGRPAARRERAPRGGGGVRRGLAGAQGPQGVKGPRGPKGPSRPKAAALRSASTSASGCTGWAGLSWPDPAPVVRPESPPIPMCRC